jgi:hypothetical protein
MPSIIGSYPWIYHNLFDRKRQLRTTESYISKNDLQDSLNFIFTGKCPLYKLNELAYLMLSRRSLVDQSDADNIILRCADGSSIKAHQAILDLKCSNFTTAPVERATALQVLHFIYDGQVDDAVFDNVDAFIALCQTWGVKNFEEHLEKSLINYYLKYKGDSISFVQHLEKFKNHIDIKTPFSNLYKLMQ